MCICLFVCLCAYETSVKMQSTTDFVDVPKAKSSIGAARPSSPRQFFERLYGHLESTDSNSKAVCSPGQSELSSSPDILDDR